MSLPDHLSEIVGGAFAELGLDPTLGEVVYSQRPELGQFQCNGALGAKTSDRPPREVAGDVATKLAGHPDLAAVEVAGPGFLNLRLNTRTLAAWTEAMTADDRLGVAPAPQPETVVVDYAGPNVAKAMHVGHLRATIIGDSIARTLSFLGHRVIRDPHFGDWGLQMGLVIAELESRHPDWPYFDADSSGPYPDESPVTLDELQDIYPAASDRDGRDPAFAATARTATIELQRNRPGYVALWRHMKRSSEEAQRRNFADLGVTFDIWYGESDVADRLGPMVARLRSEGSAEESDGAVIVRVDDVADNRQLPPLILETSGGAFLYSTTDLATVTFRAEELGADAVLYVVDNRQADHFVQVFRAARKAGLVPDRLRLEHIGFGTMNGPDGRPFKTREGGSVSLRDLIDMVGHAAARRLDEAELAREYSDEERRRIAHQVGIAALKFGDLVNNRASDYVFDLGRFSSFEGKTGPYLQYAAVRIKSLLRRADEAGLERGPVIAASVEQEERLMLELSRLPSVVERAAHLRAPNHLAEYAYALAGTFNRFYDACHVLSEEDTALRAGWLSLVAVTLETLVRVLDLLGIEVPERM